jgi:internalin A
VTAIAKRCCEAQIALCLASAYIAVAASTRLAQTLTMSTALRSARVLNQNAIATALYLIQMQTAIKECDKVNLHPQLNLNLGIPGALPSFQPLATLALLLWVSSFPAQAVPLQETTNPRSFADWCLNQAKLTVETKHTVDAMLLEARTEDCQQASKLLSRSTKLFLYNKQITDLRPLSTLTNLTVLSLAENQIADLKPLSSLRKLTALYLYNNQIADLKPLSTLTNLTILTLGHNQIADLKPLSTLTNLTILTLSHNQIADLKPLSSLTQLGQLTLDNNQIADLKPLSSLTQLGQLTLSNNQIANLKPLSTLTNLNYLNLGNNPSLTDKTCPVKPESICSFVPLPSW